MYCPVTGGLCESRKPKLKTCFLKKYTENFGRDVKAEYICLELSKYIFRGTYTILDLARTFKEISQEVRNEAFQQVQEYIKTLPCNLAFTYIIAENLLRPPRDFVEASKIIYLSQASENVKKLVKICIFCTEFIANKILSELIELIISLVDLQLTSSSTLMRHLMQYFRLYYTFNSLLTIPLYLIYTSHNKIIQNLRSSLDKIAEETSNIVLNLETKLASLSPTLLDESDDVFSMLLQLNSKIISRLPKHSEIIVAQKLRDDVRVYYVLRRELLHIDLNSLMMEALRKFNPSLIESPFNLYLLLSLIIEERFLLRLAREQICSQYLSDEYTYTFRMYFPVNAALDDVLTETILELYTLRQDVLLGAFLADRGLQLLDTVHSLKSMVLAPSRKIAVYSLQNMLFLHSALLDTLTWSLNLNFDKLWNHILKSIDSDKKRDLISHGRDYLIDALDRVTDILYLVTYVFYIRKEFEEIFNSYTSRLISICKSSS